MTVTYRFFENGDYYSQENFADFIRSLLTDGYIPNVGNELAVSATSPATMAVNIGTGMAVIHGYIVENENSPVTIPIDAPHSSLPRIDRIIIRLSATSNRNITFTILKGTPASSPAAPTLTQNEETFELSLAQIRVNANVSTISSGNITNERKQALNYPLGLHQLASKSEYGIVKIGSGISISEGVISVLGASIPIYVDISRVDSGNGAYINNSNGFIGVATGFRIHNASETSLSPVTVTASGHVDGGSWGGSFGGTVTATATNHMNGTTRVAGTGSCSGATGSAGHGGDFRFSFTGYVGETFSLSWRQTSGSAEGMYITSSSVTGNACYVGPAEW